MPSPDQMPAAAADTSAYDRLQVIAHERTHRKVLEIFAGFPNRGTLLEIPAGEGALAWQLHKLGYAVTAGDIDPEFFKVKLIRCIRIDLNQRLPIDDACFDFVSCIEGIEHLQDQFHFVRECRRILKPGGHLMLSTPNILNLASRLKFMFSGFYSLVPRPINEFSLIPVFDHINPATYYQLRYMLHSQGFEIIRVETDLLRRSAAALLFLRPLIQLYCIRTMRKERDAQQRRANRQIRAVMNSPKLLLGRTLIVVAQRTENRHVRTVQASDVGPDERPVEPL